jgi:transcriptional regulator with XRE-family HTH domain
MSSTLGLTEELAERSRLNPTTITKAEAGQTDPRLSLIDSLARGLGVPPAALIEELAAHGDEPHQ